VLFPLGYLKVKKKTFSEMLRFFISGFKYFLKKNIIIKSKLCVDICKTVVTNKRGITSILINHVLMASIGYVSNLIVSTYVMRFTSRKNKSRLVLYAIFQLDIFIAI
jgi:hypothetical protein